jgi:putative endonuclease
LGLSVLERNVRLGYLEIDIVAREGSVLVVVEVRRRSAASRTSGFSSINREKRLRLRHAGERLWNRRYKKDATLTRVRFDVASVTYDNPRPVIEYVRGAF